MSKIKNPEQYIGRFVWSRRRGRAQVLEYIAGRNFLYKAVETQHQFTGGLGTTVKLLK